MEDINREIVNGANPSIIWSQYMDFLATYGKQMKATYTKRMRENNPFTWAELDVMNKDIHDKLDKLMTWSDNLEVESKKLQKQRITESKLKKIIGESIKRIISELDAQTYYNAARKRYLQADYGGNGRANNPEMVNKGNQLSRYADDMFQKQYGVSVYDVSNPAWRDKHPGHPASKAWAQINQQRP